MRGWDVTQPPFPWFGGKSRAASLIWSRLGNVDNYVEPFFGSGAVLLNRPYEPKIETVNDLDGFVVNFWRAVKHDPEAVARHADNPVNEADLHARHVWLVGKTNDLLDRLMGDPGYYDAQVAGWWCWGLCCWIGRGWCAGNGPWVSVDGVLVRRTAGQGINRQLPHLGNAGRGELRTVWLLDYFAALSDRLRHVRVACGDWSRVVTPSVTTRHDGITGVLLDPPYAHPGRAITLYRHDDMDVAERVALWAAENGDNPRLRIALCAYDGDVTMPDGWHKVQWTNRGGYGSQGSNGDMNRFREVVWFSPHCINPAVIPTQTELFDGLERAS